MKIILDKRKPKAIVLHLLCCFIASSAVLYSNFIEANNSIIGLCGILALAAYAKSFLLLNSKTVAEEALDKMLYMVYYPDNQAIHLSEQLSRIIDPKTILNQDVLQLNDTTHNFKQILEAILNNAYPETPVFIPIQHDTTTTYYKLTFDKIADKIAVIFTDISTEYEKYTSIKHTHQHNLGEKELLRKALDNIPVAIWIRNRNMEIIYFNNMYSHIAFGHDKAFESESLEIDKFAKPNAIEALIENKIKVYERHVVTDGKRYLYKFTDIPLISSDIVIGVGYDINYKEVSQQEIEEMRESHKNVLESSSYACMIIGQDKKLKFYNRAFVKFWGPDEEILNSETTHEQILDHLYAKRKLPEQSNYAKFKKERTNLFTQLTSPREDLFYLPNGVCLRGVAIPHPGNGILFTYEDITDRLTLESLYKTLTEVQKSTIDNLQEGICVFNENGEIELLNTKMTKLWGVSNNPLEKKLRLLDILEKISGSAKSKKRLGSYKTDFANVISSRTPTKRTIKCDDGKVIHRIMIPLPDGAILLSDLDVTDSFAAQNSLAERNKALEKADNIKSQFLGSISYELRSPLTSIMGMSQLLLEQHFGDMSAKQMEYLNDIVSAAKDLSCFVDDAIELTSINSGYAKFKKEKFDLVKLLKDAMKEWAVKLEDKELFFVPEYKLSNAPCRGDKNMIRKVIGKLLENAVRRSKSSDNIKIDLSQGKNKYLLSIIDNGREVNYLPNNPAHGIGLALATGIIRMHHGNIISKSLPDNSSAFIIEIPFSI